MFVLDCVVSEDNKKIIENFDIVHVSTGDLFRQKIEKSDSVGKAVAKYISDGKLVPDVFVVDIILSKIKEELYDKNFLLDGFPRTIKQAEKLFMSFPLTIAINLIVPLEEILKRAEGRLVHVPSGRIYNIIFRPPKVAGRDDVTGEPLLRRPDDEPEKIHERLKIYYENTQPLVDYFKKKGILKNFDGTSSDEMWKNINKEILKQLKPKS